MRSAGSRGRVVGQALRGAGLAVALCTPAVSQDVVPAEATPVVETVNLSGPRFGATVLSDGVVRQISDNFGVHTGPVISQFGWQLEKRLVANRAGLTVVTEWVLLVGGAEQGHVIPSATWLIGLRGRGGAEFGVGPNLTPAGAALAVAGGMTFRSGGLNFPVNLALVPSHSGVRVSLLCGVNWRS